ncbi:hypothetical protein ACNOYE_17780 [Nannocystaceae bacterium ST9]
MILEITLLIAAGLGNFAWDVTGRRVSARMRRRARRARRTCALPLPAAGEHAEDPLVELHGVAPAGFVELTCRTAEELDRVADHFDLVLLRAAAAESLLSDVVYVGAQTPRARGKESLDAWLAAVDDLPPGLADRLRECGLPDQALRELLLRERERGLWPHADTASDVLEQTAGEFEHAFALLGSFLRTLGEARRDPYR